MNKPLNRERYLRQTQLANFGESAQLKLAQSKVLVVGAGGLGVPALQYLTGMGVGTIGVIDFDVISLSNLHRQVLYTEAEVGQSKVLSAITKLRALNTEVDFQIYNEGLTVGNALRIVVPYDVIIDATDNFSTRYLLNDACVMLNKPFIYGAVQQYEGHVSVFNYKGGPTYRCLYPQPPKANEIPDCNTAGILGVVPGIIGMLQALQAVKVITGVGQTLSGYLQIHDFLSDEQYKIKLKANPENKDVKVLQDTYQPIICKTVQQLSVEELYDWYESGKSFRLIDVRERGEFAEEHLKNAVSYPLTQLKPAEVKFDAADPIVFFCEKGARSSKAALMLQQQYPAAKVYSVLGGMDFWHDEFDDEYLVRL